MAAHSMESFCEHAWTLADYVVNKRLQEPKMFKVHNHVVEYTVGRNSSFQSHKLSFTVLTVI